MPGISAMETQITQFLDTFILSVVLSTIAVKSLVSVGLGRFQASIHEAVREGDILGVSVKLRPSAVTTKVLYVPSCRGICVPVSLFMGRFSPGVLFYCSEFQLPWNGIFSLKI